MLVALCGTIEQCEGLIQSVKRAFKQADGHRVIAKLEGVDRLHGVLFAGVQRVEIGERDVLWDFSGV